MLWILFLALLLTRREANMNRRLAAAAHNSGM